MLESSAELARKLSALDKRYDAQLKVVFQVIRELIGAQCRCAEPDRLPGRGIVTTRW